MSDTRDIQPANPGTAEIDWSVLDSFQALARPGRPDPAARLLALFLESSLSLADAIRAAVSAADGPGLKKAAHSLKSAARNLGAVGLGTICEEMEHAGDNGAGTAGHDLLERLEKEYAAVADAFREALQRRGG